MARYNSALTSNTITGTATIGSPYSGAFTEFTGTAPYTVTLPTPVAFPGVTQTFYNATSGTVTLSTPAGNFVGTGSSGASTVPIYSGNVVSIVSDGSNYVVISEDGSPLIATTGSFSSNVTINGGSATLSVTPSVVTMAPTASSTIDNIAIGPNTRASGAFTTLTSNNAVTFTANTASSSTGTGSLVVTGGIGASGTIYAGAFNGNLTGTLQTAAQPNITSTGGLTVPGLTATGTILSQAATTASAGSIQVTASDASLRLKWTSSPVADKNTWEVRSVGTGATPYLQFRTINDANTVFTDRVAFTNDGNVGIATTNPQAKLTVKGQTHTAPWFAAERSGSATLQFKIVGAEDTGYTASTGTVSPQWTNVIDSNNSNIMLSTLLGGGTGGKIILDGNVGIGTTTMTRVFNISGTNPGTGLNINNTGTSGRSFSIFSTNSSASVAGVLGFYDDTAGAYCMVIDSSGNLSVGNPSAFGRISAVKSGKATIAGVDTAAYAQGVGGTLDLGGNYRASGDYTAFVRIAAEKTNATNADYGYDMGFYVTTNNGATMGTKALTIASSGNVGIGSTTPAGILDVGDNRLSSQTYLRNNGNYGGGGGGQTTFNMIFGGMPIAIINNTGTGQRDGQFRLLDENVTKVNIVANASRGGPTYFNGGNVGIGITDPRTLLQVAVPSQNYVSFGNTGYGAGDWYGIHVGYCEAANTSYRKHMLAYESLNDGAARGNLHLLVNTTYGSASATIADSKLMISGTTGNVAIASTVSVGGGSSNERLFLSGSVQGWNGTTARYANYHYDFYQNGYNSGVGNSNYTLFYYAYDQANWNYQTIKVIVKRGYYLASGEAAYMINCQNATVRELYNQDANTTTASFSFSNNTINAYRRITTVTFLSPNTYMTWGFKIETFGINHSDTATSTPANGYISFS